MPADLSITVDTKQVERDLRAVPKAIRGKVIPAALNRTADEALRAVKRDLPQHFTIRSGWVAKGLRTDKAKPATPAARLYHKDAYMVRQEMGGTKEGRDGGRVAVPILGMKPGEKRTKVTRPRDWPGRVQSSFLVEARSNGALLLYQRLKPKGRRPKGTRRGTPLPRGFKDPNLRLMYILHENVKVKPRWRFLEQVTRVVDQRWTVNVDGYLRLALDGRLK